MLAYSRHSLWERRHTGKDQLLGYVRQISCHMSKQTNEKKNDQENIEKYQQSAFLVGEFCRLKRHRQSLAKAELENTVEGTRLRYSTILLIVNDEYKNIYNISSCNRLMNTMMMKNMHKYLPAALCYVLPWPRPALRRRAPSAVTR